MAAVWWVAGGTTNGMVWHAVPWMGRSDLLETMQRPARTSAASHHRHLGQQSPFFFLNINTIEFNLYFIKWSLYISLLSIPKHQRLKNANSVLPFEVLRERGLQSQLHSFLICNREREGGKISEIFPKLLIWQSLPFRDFEMCKGRVWGLLVVFVPRFLNLWMEWVREGKREEKLILAESSCANYLRCARFYLMCAFAL